VQNAEILASFSEMPWAQIFQAIAVSGIIFSFNGFNQATVFAGEAKNPQKTIPFAILGSLLFSGLLYVLVQYVFLVSVPREYLAQGWSNLHFAGDQGPFAGIAALLGLTWLLSLIYADAVISPMGTAFTYASSAPRLFYAIAENNNIFPKLRQLNRFGVSTIAMLLTFVLTLISFALLPNLKAMISILVAAFVLCYTVAPASLLRFRKTHAHLPRHFRIPGALIFSYLSLFFSQLMVFSCGWTSVRNLLVAAGIMIGVYLLAMWRSGRRIVDSAPGCEWFLLQIVGLSLLCYVNHIEEMPFTIVATAIAVLSAVVLLLSQYRFHQAS
jgi:amino acid transporter